MAVWERIGSRGDVEDRRGMSTIAGGIGVVGIALIAGITLLAGGDLGDVANNIFSIVEDQGLTQQNTQEFEGEDSYERFASTVLGSNNDMWNQIFQQQNRAYTTPKLVLFRNATQSGCGIATSDVGPHYCPFDRTIYLDETFFDELKTYLGGSNEDVAQAYVISHEVGHHIQNILGDLEGRQTNEDSIKIELQADCYAGLWGNYISDLNILEPNEIQEAIDAASAVGDDRIQQKVEGQINPETWTHGSSAQRVESFNKGYTTGNFNSCRL